MLVATYVTNYVQQKEGKGKGQTFHLYNITGTPEEMKEYINNPQFKKYPVHAADGTPQFRTQYMDALRDVLPLYKKQNGEYTLDGSETRKDVSRIDALAKISPALEKEFAGVLVQKITGGIPSVAGGSIASRANATPEPESTGDDTDMDKM